MPEIQRTVSPIDGSVYVERELASHEQITDALVTSKRAQEAWKHTPVAERAGVCRRFVQAMLSKREQLGMEITWQMGRPIRYAPKEIDRLADRANYMIDVAEESLADVRPQPIEGFDRFIRREPHGVVAAIVPWNYPYLTAVNTVVPAVMAGNSVVLKHSPQTPLCAERLAEAFQEAGLPEGVFQYLHVRTSLVPDLIASPLVDFVAFTGSVQVGRDVLAMCAPKYGNVALELGGKDPAYVRADAELDNAVENLVDGAFFNSGQSCCAIERIYVHADVYDRFIEGAVELTKGYVLGNPLVETTTLGPMVSPKSAASVRSQIEEAVALGAKLLVDEAHFPQLGGSYLPPQILVDVDHSMRVMQEESFGPVVGVMKVDSDEEAIRLMNDSPFGLTASIWTTDEAAALRIGGDLQTGTCFMNRCDYLDPALAWTGVKDSGHGCTLSVLGYSQLTRPKSYHLKLK